MNRQRLNDLAAIHGERLLTANDIDELIVACRELIEYRTHTEAALLALSRAAYATPRKLVELGLHRTQEKKP